jgi:hypothetical protein
VPPTPLVNASGYVLPVHDAVALSGLLLQCLNSLPQALVFSLEFFCRFDQGGRQASVIDCLVAFVAIDRNEFREDRLDILCNDTDV